MSIPQIKPTLVPCVGATPVEPSNIQPSNELEDELESSDEEPLMAVFARKNAIWARPTPDGPSSHSGTAKDELEGSSTKASSDRKEGTDKVFKKKAPVLKVTFHAPAGDIEHHHAMVTVQGATTNSVREIVMLSDDYFRQEIALFTKVFVPAQQALQTPDPEPALAALNFHVIAVWVLSTFTSYEHGDEQGRGYGFYGGNIGGQPLRPSSSATGSRTRRVRSAQDADVDEIFFAALDLWRVRREIGAHGADNIRGPREFTGIAMHVIDYVKTHGLSPPKPENKKPESNQSVDKESQAHPSGVSAKGAATRKRSRDAT